MNKKQSGFAHLAIITVILAIAVIGLLGFVFWQNFVQSGTGNSNKNKTSSKTEQTKNTQKSTYISELSQTLKYPSEYTISKTDGDQSTPVSYDFSTESNSDVRLMSLSFTNSTIVENSEKACAEANALCEGDLITPSIYNSLVSAAREFKEQTVNYSGRTVKYELVNGPGLNSWLAGTHDNTYMKQGYIREYLSLADGGDTLLSVKVEMLDTKKDSEADKLFSRLTFKDES